MRLVVDTNVVVSAFLWQGTPGRLLELGGDKEVRLFTSRVLLDELADVLSRKKLARKVAATGLQASEMLLNYRKVVKLVTARQLPGGCHRKRMMMRYSRQRRQPGPI